MHILHLQKHLETALSKTVFVMAANKWRYLQSYEECLILGGGLQISICRLPEWARCLLWWQTNVKAIT